jgi:hypothetical protein
MNDQTRQNSGSQSSQTGSAQQTSNLSGGNESMKLQDNYSDQDWSNLSPDQQEEYHRRFPDRRQRSGSSEGSTR